MRLTTRFAIFLLCFLLTSCSVFRRQTTKEYNESSISAYIATDSIKSNTTTNTVLSIHFDTSGKIVMPQYLLDNIFMPHDTTTAAKEIILEGVTNIEIMHNNISQVKEFSQLASYNKTDTLSTEIGTDNASDIKKTINYGLIIYVIVVIFVFVLYIACKRGK